VARKLEPRAVVPLGDCAAYIEFADKLDLEVNAFMQQLAAAVHARARPWIRDVVPALGGIALHYDPDHPEVHGDALEAAAILVQECMKGDAAAEEPPLRAVEVLCATTPRLHPTSRRSQDRRSSTSRTSLGSTRGASTAC